MLEFSCCIAQLNGLMNVVKPGLFESYYNEYYLIHKLFFLLLLFSVFFSFCFLRSWTNNLNNKKEFIEM